MPKKKRTISEEPGLKEATLDELAQEEARPRPIDIDFEAAQSLCFQKARCSNCGGQKFFINQGQTRAFPEFLCAKCGHINK